MGILPGIAMDDIDDAELLRRWNDADDAAGDRLIGRRLREADQRLLTRSARADDAAVRRFAERHLADLDQTVVARILADGRLQRALAAHDADLALLARWADGNRGAADALFERYYPVLDRFVLSKCSNPSDAADIVQSTFKDLTRQHRSIQNFRAFMFKVAVNKVKAWYCRQYSGKDVDTGASGISSLAESSGQALEARAEDRRNRKLLLVALQSLPLDDQMLLELYAWEDFTAADVGAMLGIPLHTVKYRLRTAKAAIKAFVERHGDRVGHDVETHELVAFLDDLHARAPDQD